MAETETLPRWDLTPIFPSLESLEFDTAFAEVCREINELGPFFDQHHVRRREFKPVEAVEADAFNHIIERLGALKERLRVLTSYLYCLVSTEADNDAAQGKLSELKIAMVALGKLETRFQAWAGTMHTENLLQSSETAREHEYLVRTAACLAAHQMSEAEEALATELGPASIQAWARLHGDMTALMTVNVSLPDGEKSLPMSAVRGLANDPDREVRKAAHEAEIAGWKTVEVPLAAALNGIKGYQRTLRDKRCWSDDVEPTLLANSIDAATLAAMQEACVESFEDFRRYMQAKAQILGLEKLAWYDMSAPVGSAARRYSWDEAEDFIRTQFGAYSQKLADFADRTFRESWTDAEPRSGKEGGAYCTGLRPGESRVMMNYDGSFNSVSTLAHELGHAYHNLCLKDRPPLLRRAPSTLAETASIFCETLAFDAAIRDSEGDERLGLLEISLQRDLQVVVDIHSRFLFEKGVFERRALRELSGTEFCELMLDAQRQTYGDGLDEDTLHPYMWAVKGHYYGPTFYNYPYTFGLLFGMGLYARYRSEPEGFHAGYDDLLSSTGLADAATLAERFGIDTRSVEFWRSSLDVIRGNIVEFERLARLDGSGMAITRKRKQLE